MKWKQTMDEMDRSIHLRSEEWGCRVTLLSLCGWALWSSWQTVAGEAPYNPWPALILCSSTVVQGFVRLGLQQRMAEGDEEYQGPNRLLQAAVGAAVAVVLVVSLGIALTVWVYGR